MTFKTVIFAGLSAVMLAGVSAVAEAKDPPKLGETAIEKIPYDDNCLRLGRNPDCSGPRDFYPRKRYIYPNFYPQPHGLNWDDSDYDTPHMAYRIDCGEARAMVRERGFRKVVTRDCSGRNYSFTGSKNGRRYVVTVNARTGRIRASAL